MSVDITALTSPPISSERWPDVARIPSGPLSMAAAPIADRLFCRSAARLPLRLVYPDGTVVGAADPTLPTMVILHPTRLARRETPNDSSRNLAPRRAIWSGSVRAYQPQ